MTTEPKFLRRFEQIRTSLRRYQGRVGLAATILAAAIGLGLLAWSDYRPRAFPARPGGRALAVATLATLVVVLAMVRRAAPLVDPAEDGRRDRGAVPAARPAHPDGRAIRRPSR